MIHNFTNLIAWQKSHELVLNIYKILKKLPNEEKFALADQMRRSSVSITSNIAEGFSRNTRKDKVQFYTISKGSLSELQSQLITARDLGYITDTDFKELDSMIEQSSKLISGIIKSAIDK
ncbi:MAG: four helix bundle protein [Candidatus Paceibacterota bacterium]|jgi:four helix bundle protein